jgi:hypothetical protein
LGLEVTEVPVTVRYLNGHSTTTAHDIVDMLRKLWSIRRAWHELPTPQGIPLVTLAEPEA